ncbi:dihydrolipoamide acetyltransferase family protein [Neobacillus sp. SM06]|uniref:dihydrolipoamide acetyltransferase family protein n=1 Tax=Neobacillus sp. SM06 TaxID=3422492 RepID=UPI003D2AE09B
MYEIKLPQTAEDISESVIVFWHKYPGDEVKAGDVLVEVQTEKAVFEIEAEESGILTEIKIPRGEVASVGDVLATISPAAEAVPENSHPINREDAPLAATAHKEPTQFVKAPPRIRRLARELGVDLATIAGTGRNGHITEEDVRRSAAAVTAPEYKVVPITGIRKTIASRMTESLRSSAQLTETAWADVTLLDEERKRADPKLTWNDLILFAAVQALKQHPNMNAHVLDEIHQYEKIHLGIAVDTEEGLFVPVIKNAGELSLVQLAAQARSLADKAREGRLAASDLSGATFTVTNLGSYGVQFFTPIINRPEAAILGVGKIETDLVFQERQIVERKRLPLSLTFDHRAIDGAPAARFLQTLIRFLQEPSKLLDEILAK